MARGFGRCLETDREGVVLEDEVAKAGEFAVGDFIELSSGDDHRLKMSILRAGAVTRQILSRKSRIGNLKLFSFRSGWRAT